jgi:hypothetical protein
MMHGQQNIKIIHNVYLISYDSMKANMKEYVIITDEITKCRQVG